MTGVVRKWKLKISNKRGFKAYIKSLKKEYGKRGIPLEEALDFDLGLKIVTTKIFPFSGRLF